MFAHHWFGIIEGFFERGQGAFVPEVAESDGRVAEQAAALGALEGTAHKLSAEGCGGQREGVDQVRAGRPASRLVLSEVEGSE